MKKIEVMVRPEKVRVILSAMMGAGAVGVTVVSERGQGSGERPMIRDSKGMPLHTAEYNTINSVITIVNDSMVNAIMEAIAKVTQGTHIGSGKVFVSSVEETMDLETGRRSSNL